jgi:hypothetical protein
VFSIIGTVDERGAAYIEMPEGEEVMGRGTYRTFH